jgi:hypothetical protein
MAGGSYRGDDQNQADRYRHSADLVNEHLNQATYFQNPGRVDLSQTNPELNAQIEQLKQMQLQAQGIYNDSMDSSKYNQRIEEMQGRAGTSLQNRYNQMGLGGSAVAMGAIGEQNRQINMGMRDRQLGEQMRALQMQEGLNGQVQRSILAGQGQYNGYQMQNYQKDMGILGYDTNQANHFDSLGMQAATNNAAMTGQVIGSVGTIGGAVAGGLIGGPAGAVVGAGVGRGLTSSQTAAYGQMEEGQYVDNNFTMPNYGGSYATPQGYAGGYYK